MLVDKCSITSLRNIDLTVSFDSTVLSLLPVIQANRGIQSVSVNIIYDVMINELLDVKSLTSLSLSGANLEDYLDFEHTFFTKLQGLPSLTTLQLSPSLVQLPDEDGDAMSRLFSRLYKYLTTNCTLETFGLKTIIGSTFEYQSLLDHLFGDSCTISNISICLYSNRLPTHIKRRINFDLTAYVLHLMVIDSGYTCIGTSQDQKQKCDKKTPPAGWNSSPDSYSFVYENDKDTASTIVIKSLRLGNTLLVNGMSPVDPDKIHTLDIEQLVKQQDFKLIANFKDVFSNLDALAVVFNSNVLRNLTNKRSSLLEEEHTVERNKQQSINFVQNEPSGRLPQQPAFVPLVGGAPYFGGGGRGGGFGDFHTGDSDLTPTGFPRLPNQMGGAYRPSFPGDGNMIGRDHPGFGQTHFSPHGDDRSTGLPGSERLPRGAVPPGARFDPFGPPPPMGGRNPQPRSRYGDELPPPGGDDFYS
eukprot:gene14241-16805_t